MGAAPYVCRMNQSKFLRNLPEYKVTNQAEAEAFLDLLIELNLTWHPEDDAHGVVWDATRPTPEQCDHLNRLMGEIYAATRRTEFCPCGYILEKTR